MMFSFSTWNHCRQGRIIVQDITVPLGRQIAALGHDVRWGEAPAFIGPRDGYNVVLESFADDPRTLEAMSAARAAGCRFLIIATEEPTSAGFNHGLEPAMIDRQAAFPAAAALADGILHLIPGDEITRWYGQFAPAAYAEIGHAPGASAVPDVEPTHDFGFYGKMTWRREEMLARLGRMGTVLRITSLDVPRDERDALMRGARVIVQIRANNEWDMVSSTRCASALGFGRPVVAEPHLRSDPWNRVVQFSISVEDFYRDAFVAVCGWRAMHAAQAARFAEILSPERCVGEPLRRIGVLS